MFYAMNLALGLVGFLTVDSFKGSLERKVSEESKLLLGSDLAVRARRDLTQEEVDAIMVLLPKGSEKIEVLDFFSMVAGPEGKSRLVKIIAMEPGFPFYGSFDLKLKGRLKGTDEKLIHNRKHAWIYPELESQLGAGIGEEIRVGDAKFKVSDFVLEESGLQFQPAELAPKVFIAKSFLKETNLLLNGNTAFRNHLIRLPEGSDSANVEKALIGALSSPEIRVYTHQRAGHRAGRLLRYLSDFLSLVSLVALFPRHPWQRLPLSFLPNEKNDRLSHTSKPWSEPEKSNPELPRSTWYTRRNSHPSRPPCNLPMSSRAFHGNRGNRSRRGRCVHRMEEHGLSLPRSCLRRLAHRTSQP